MIFFIKTLRLMKLTVFLILLGLLRVSAVTNAQVYRINLELENGVTLSLFDGGDTKCVA